MEQVIVQIRDTVLLISNSDVTLHEEEWYNINFNLKLKDGLLFIEKTIVRKVVDGHDNLL